MKFFSKLLFCSLFALVFSNQIFAQGQWIDVAEQLWTNPNLKAVGIRTADPRASLHVEQGEIAKLDSNGYLMLGKEDGNSLVFDTNSIMARSKGKPISLFLNENGGNIYFNMLNQDKAARFDGQGNFILGSLQSPRGRFDARLDSDGRWINFGHTKDSKFAGFDYDESLDKITFSAGGEMVWAYSTRWEPETLRFFTNTVFRGYMVVDEGIETSSITTDALHIGNWTIDTPDYVFQPDYYLRSLNEVADFIAQNSHLPEVPSAADMKAEGLDLAEFSMTLLKKVEELTLYTLEQQKELDSLKSHIKNAQ